MGGTVDTQRYDVLVVGAGPAGSVAALCLARGGARVALLDKASFPRDKACGDLVGPRGVRLLEDLGVELPESRQVGDMEVSGPTGRRVSLPCREGSSYPGHGVAVTRLVFDDVLRRAAVGAGAEPRTGRAGEPIFEGEGLAGFVTSAGEELRADVVLGADGATSHVASVAGLVDPARSLWGFALRSYVEADVEVPLIAWWETEPWKAFAGYGWAFPGPGPLANVGLGMALLGDRRKGALPVRLMARIAGDAPSLGGWLKMGMAGTEAARGRVLLLGDAAGLVNPLQGEGIAPAMWSGRAAAEAVLAGPSGAAGRYREALDARFGAYYPAAAAIQAVLVGRPRAAALVERVLTTGVVGACLAGSWALFWNDLVDGAPHGGARNVAVVAGAAGRALSRAPQLRALRRPHGLRMYSRPPRPPAPPSPPRER
ncbi:MAG: geranylgeranyl reductase family protein [Actinomycetota bacterium]|nr:geranylgeranyl reductase family protein [Actinomycetota bacterium]